MTAIARLVPLSLAAFGLGGCVAAAIPVAAGGAIAGKQLIGDGDRVARADASAPAPAQGDGTPTIARLVEGPLPPPVPNPPAAMQYLYGSGEAAALSVQSYMALANFLIARSTDRSIGHEIPSMVLAPGSTLAAPQFVPCDDKPLALVLDVDETALLNLGYEEDEARRGTGYDAERWDRWEKTGAGAVAAVPGAAMAIDVARRVNIAVIFNSNRSAVNAAQTAAAIEAAGLGPAVRGDTLWLRGDAGDGSGKDARRWRITEKYCVVAMAGDQLGDFSDLFNASDLSLAARRDAVQSRKLELLWGKGWFMLPNPVYGTGLQGGFDEIFPADKQWADPAGGQ